MNLLKHCPTPIIRRAIATLMLSVVSSGLFAATADVEVVKTIARLYSAAFDRDPLDDGLNFWVRTYERDSPIADIADRFTKSPEFTSAYGPIDDTEFVELLFRNVLGRDGAQAGIDFWVGNIEDGSSRARVLARFADSPENIDKTAETFADMRLVDGQWTFESDEAPVSSNNLIATALEIDSQDPRIGYPLAVTVSVEALEATEDVSVAFFALDKDRENVRQLPLGARTISQMAAGNNIIQLDLDIPTSFEIAGPYYLGVLVDAADIIEESNEEDNEASAVMTLSPVEVPNLFIEHMEPDRTALVLDRTAYDYQQQSEAGVVNSDAGGTISWGVKGTAEPLNVEAFAVLRLTRSDVSDSEPPVLVLSVDPTDATTTASDNYYDVPLYLWDSAAERYINAYGVDPEFGGSTAEEWLPLGRVGELLVKGTKGRENVPVSEFDRRSAHLDFYFPGRFAEELEIALRKLNVLFGPIVPPPDLSAADIQALRSFLSGVEPEMLSTALCVRIRPSDPAVIEDRSDDNETCSPLALVLPDLAKRPPTPTPPPVPPLNPSPGEPGFFDQLFQTVWGDDNFGFEIDFGASASADNRGVIVQAYGVLPITVFGASFEFVRVDGRAQVVPLSERDNPPPGQSPGFTLELSHQRQILSSVDVASGSVGPIQLSYSKDLVSPKEKIFTIGPVPIKVKASVTGNIGVEYAIAFGAEANNGLEYTTAPFANIEASASAAVTGLIADVGVEGVITLVEEKFEVTASATINVADDRHTDGTSEIVIVPRLEVVNEITGPQGAINLFVSIEVPKVKKCSWGFFTGLCPGIATLKYPYNLISWRGYAKRDILLDEQVLIDIITLPDGTVSYYR